MIIAFCYFENKKAMIRNDFDLTADTLANAIITSFYFKKKDIALVLSKRLERREVMRMKPDLDEEEPLSDEEFQAWVDKHNLN